MTVCNNDSKRHYRIGIDAGSTTIKFVVIDVANGQVVFNSYRRHFADIRTCIEGQLHDMAQAPEPSSDNFDAASPCGSNVTYSVCITASAVIALS